MNFVIHVKCGNEPPRYYTSWGVKLALLPPVLFFLSRPYNGVCVVCGLGGLVKACSPMECMGVMC